MKVVLTRCRGVNFCGRYMTGQTERGEWRETRNDPSRSIRYKLKHELRRLERHGRGTTPYASAIREVLWALSSGDGDDLVALLELEMSHPTEDEADEPYAQALRAVLSKLYESQSSAYELFTYFLRRLEAQGRGQEPFAMAIREALASNDTSTLSALLHSHVEGDKDRE